MPRGYPVAPATLGEHVRRRRFDLAMGQRTLGVLLGVRTETVANWELGRTRPLARHVSGLIRFLGHDPEANEASLAGRVRALRRRLGLTLAEQAERLGLDQGTVIDLEHGRRRVSHRVRALTQAFLAEFGATWLTGRSGTTPPQDEGAGT